METFAYTALHKQNSVIVQVLFPSTILPSNFGLERRTSRHYFDPVPDEVFLDNLSRIVTDLPIRIEDESDPFHLTVIWLLFEGDAKFLEPLASHIHIVHGYSDMTKASARIRITICITLEVRIVLGPMVVRKFEYAYSH
jgi:hypothetical protein